MVVISSSILSCHVLPQYGHFSVTVFLAIVSPSKDAPGVEREKSVAQPRQGSRDNKKCYTEHDQGYNELL